jgi:hypothetical protein
VRFSRSTGVRFAVLGALVVTLASGASSFSDAATASVTFPPATRPAPPGPVPAQYATMYAGLKSQLDSYQEAVNAMPDYRVSGRSTPPFVAAAELLDANGNRQDELLQAGALNGVGQELDALKRLGVRGVTIGIKLPLLLQQYTPQAAKYADFYAAVAKQARVRGFTVDVELGGLFCGTVFSTCTYAYPHMVSGWARLTAEQAKIVIARVHPQYLDILSEPNTEAELTSIPALETLNGVVQFVTSTLQQMGRRGTTKIGAGAASWFPVSFDRAIAKTSVDVLIDHIYPLSANIIQTVRATAALAHETHKPLVADEVWLYKSTPSLNGGVTASGSEAKLDAFSFFEPLDERFLSITREWSIKADVAFTSPFWSQQLFSYTTWTSQLEAESTTSTLVLLNQEAAAAMANGAFSASGLAWARSP